MSTSLLNIVGKLSEIYKKKKTKKKCNGCMERKKIRSECNLLGLKIINYTTNVKYAKKRWLKPVYGLIKKFSSAYEFRKGDIIKFVLLLRKGVFPTNTWIGGKALTKHHYRIKKISAVN